MFKRLLPVTKMIYSGSQLEKEVGNIVPTVPSLKPFDLSIRLNHLLTQGAWQIPFARIGFDVVFIHSNKRAPLDPSPEAASYHESDLRLREGERKKYARARGGTNAISGKTLTPDEVIGEINDANQCFIPIAIGPHGEIGSTFRRFWDGSDPLPLPPFGKSRPQARRAAVRARSLQTPWNVLGRADERWKADRGGALFGGSHLCALPSTWAKQQLGLVCATQISNHINTSFNYLVYNPNGAGDRDNCDVDDVELDEPGELEWKWVDVDFLDGHRTNRKRNTTPAVSVERSPTSAARRAGASCDGNFIHTRSR